MLPLQHENCSGGNDSVFCFVSPIREAVCSRDNPARCNERTATQEALAPLKDSSDPWVRLYGCERTTHDFMHPPLRPLTTCQLCRDTHSESVSAMKEITRLHWEKLCLNNKSTCIHNRWRFYCWCGACVVADKTEIIRKIQIKHTIFQWLLKFQSQPYIWEHRRIPSQPSFLFGHSTTASGCGQGSYHSRK